MKLAPALLMATLTACALDAGPGDPDAEAPGDEDTSDGLVKESFDPIGYASTSKVYLLWYGNWTGNTALGIVPAFTQSLGGSPYFNINTSYTNASGGKVSN